MQQAIRHKLDILTFGKHKGKTVRWVLEREPSYILWLHENKVCEIAEEIVEAATDSEIEDYLDDTFGHSYSSCYED